MKFVNRVLEKQFLDETIKLSKNKVFSLVIFGLRRVGKTRLILETIEDKDVYFFVNKNKESSSLLKEYETVLKERKTLSEIESLDSWDRFFSIIFSKFSGIIIFDEFQNFANVDKSVFEILQKQIDINENKKGILFIFSGSTTGLMKKLFSDSKEPLYGRIKRKLNLKPLLFKDCIEMCSELDIKNIEEVIKLYAIFGGYPKYYVSIEDENLLGKSIEDILERFFFQENALLEEEVNQILSLEFGKRSGVYYNILSAIANGNTRISEIASFMNKKETELSRQINELVNYFELIDVERPVVMGRNVFYIKHPIINFCFRFFYKDISNYHRRSPLLIKKIKNEINAFVGRRFENVCKEYVHENRSEEIHQTGRQWGKIRGAEKGKNTYEIDIVALNEQTKDILFVECKWQSKVNAEKILAELKEKAKHVEWNNEKRKEHYAVFAKSFSKRIKECKCYDLKDMEKVLRKR